MVTGVLLAYQNFHRAYVENSVNSKAAILDGLGADFPNKTFIDSARRILENPDS